MPNWTCDLCNRRQSSARARINANTPGFWPLYRSVYGKYANVDTKMCANCHIGIRNTRGVISHQRPHSSRSYEELGSEEANSVHEEPLDAELSPLSSPASPGYFDGVHDLGNQSSQNVESNSSLPDSDSFSEPQTPDQPDQTESPFSQRTYGGQWDQLDIEMASEGYPHEEFVETARTDRCDDLQEVDDELRRLGDEWYTTEWPLICAEFGIEEPEFRPKRSDPFPNGVGDCFVQSKNEPASQDSADSQTSDHSYSQTEHFENVSTHFAVQSPTVGTQGSHHSFTSSQNGGDDSLISVISHNVQVQRVHAQGLELPFIETSKSTQRCCFICRNTQGRTRIPPCAIHDVWKKLKIRIPIQNRTCPDHLENSKFKDEVLQLMKPLSSSMLTTPELTSQWIHDLTNKLSSKIATDFSSDSDLTSPDYELLLGVSRSNFDSLMVHAQGIRNSRNRNTRNAVAMLLLKLRHNVSLRFLAFLFGMPNEDAVSNTIHSAAKTLEENFVPEFLGYNHVTREQVIEEHSIPAFSDLLKYKESTMILILDGTYVYFQRPSDHELQRLMYLLQKLHHLVKFMMVVTTTGYIVECEGPYGADGKNNDSGILKSMMKKEGESILGFYDVGDVAVLDRGFRDAVEELEGRQVWPRMPNLLPRKRMKFSTAEGNESRQITMMRWIVEAVNGRIKNKFHFFDDTVPNTYLPKINTFFRIACSLINAFCPPIFTASQDHTNLIQLALQRLEPNNDLQSEIEEKRLSTKRKIWKKADDTALPDFPVLNEKSLKEITLGIHQLNLASRYTKEHLTEDGAYEILIHRDDPTLISGLLQSRFCRRQTHKVWVRFEPNGVTSDSITSWVCACKTENRTLGCCAHVAALIWYLSYARHNPEKLPKSRPLGLSVLDVTMEHASLEDGNDMNDPEEEEGL